MITLKLNTYIHTPLLGKGGVMSIYTYFPKRNELGCKKTRGLARK